MPPLFPTLKPARRNSSCCYIPLLCLCLHSSCGSLSLTVVKNSPLWILLQIHYFISFPVSLTHSLVLISLQSGSILRHWHADYFMDPLADQWPLHIKGGLARLLGPSRPILALIRWLVLSGNGRGATLWEIWRRQKQSNASQLEDKNDRLSKSIPPLTRERPARLLNSPGGYKTTLVVFFLLGQQKSLSIIYQLELFNLD